MLMAAVCCFALPACRHAAHTETLPPEDLDIGVASAGKAPDIDVYIDASTPLRGFLAEPPQGVRNYFVDIIDQFDGILHGARGSRIQYWSFGQGKPRPVKSVRAFLNSAFYSESETQIDEAIRHKPEGPKTGAGVKIIVTDLFQSDNDVSTLANLLNDEFIQNPARAVAIMGIRNPFSGPIADLPGNLPRGAAESLPFYILVMGPIEDVSWCVQEIRDRTGLLKTQDRLLTLLFSRTQVSHLDQKLVSVPFNVSKPGYTLEPSRVKGASDRGIPYFISRHDFKVRPTNFPHADLLIPGPQIALPAAGRDDLIKVTGWRFLPPANPRNSKKEDSKTENKEESKEAAQAVTVDLSSGTVSVLRQRLVPQSAYLFRIDALAGKTDFADLGPWDLEIGERSRILRNGAFDAGPDGRRAGKTPNLRHFLRTLSSRMFQSEIPLAHYYFFVQAE